MEQSDIPFKVKWINDEVVRETLNFFYPISAVGTEQWLRNVCNRDDRRDFIVCDKNNDLPIGYCGLLNIDYKNLKAESYLGIGDKSYWGKRLGLEIKNTLLRYAFFELNLNKVYSFHHEDNIAMIKINKRLGGIIEGTLREDIVVPGNRFKNKVIMSILKKEFVTE